MSRTRTPAAPLTLEERLLADLAMTGGQCPIGVVVADEEERHRANAFLHGKRNARLLTVVTLAEHEAGRAKR